MFIHCFSLLLQKIFHTLDFQILLIRALKPAERINREQVRPSAKNCMYTHHLLLRNICSFLDM